MYNVFVERHLPIALKLILTFTILGTLFSGYLVVVGLFGGSCGLSKGCPLFLGYSACWSGLALHILSLILCVLIAKDHITFKNGLMSIVLATLLGIGLSGYFTMIELPAFMQKGFGAYALGVPPCFFELVFFMLTFLTATLASAYERDHNR